MEDRETVASPHATIATILAEAPQGDAVLDIFVPIAIIFAIMYFLVIRPASRERKQREAQVGAVKKHDKVVTNAGIHGTVMSVDDDTVVLRVDDKNNVRIRFSRQAIWQVNRPGSGAGSSAAKDKAEAKTGAGKG